jgi:prepilin-type N-terminal cleavage/methylation domain-containing protein
MRLVRRAIERLRTTRGESGFTLVELMVAMAVTLVIAGAAMSVFLRAMTETGVVTDRSQQQNDGRLALERMSKDVRQATALSATDKTATSLTMTTFTSTSGVSKTVSWRLNPTATSACPVNTCLQRSTDGWTTTTTEATNVKNMASPTTDLFTYVNHDNVTDEVILSLKIGTKPSVTIPFSTTILLRNLDFSTL